MSNDKDGGPAFPDPQQRVVAAGVGQGHTLDLGDNNGHGMTLRDYFAAKAMARFLPNYYTNPDQIAHAAYAQADAMLAARSGAKLEIPPKPQAPANRIIREGRL